MAKKSTVSSGTSVFDLVSSVDKSVEVLSDSVMSVISEYIGTGNYMLNACMTGSMFKGIPAGRVVCLAGAPGSSKSFISISVCREAQKMGYTPIYMDSEGAIDRDFVKKLGADPDKMMIRQVTTVSEVATFMANVLKKVNEVDKANRPKIMFVLDSLGNLTSNKELNDTIEATGKKDMSRSQDIKALFRTNATALAKAQAPMIVTSHIYQTQDLFSKTVVNGGSGIGFNASITLLLTTSKLDDKESDKIMEKKTGDYVKSGVVVTAKPEKSRFTIPQKVRFMIPFFKAPNPYMGLDQYVTWENSGIMLYAKMLQQKEYDKLSEADKLLCKEFVFEGDTVYAYPKATSKTFVSSILGELPMKEFFTKKVFTDEFLHKLDDEVIKPLFELPEFSSDTDLDEFIGNDEDNTDE